MRLRVERGEEPFPGGAVAGLGRGDEHRDRGIHGSPDDEKTNPFIQAFLRRTTDPRTVSDGD
jgi:hypothetical protein